MHNQSSSESSEAELRETPELVNWELFILYWGRSTSIGTESKMHEAHSHSSAARRQDSQDDAGSETATPVDESQHAGQKQDVVAEEPPDMEVHIANPEETRKDADQLSQNAGDLVVCVQLGDYTQSYM